MEKTSVRSVKGIKGVALTKTGNLKAPVFSTVVPSNASSGSLGGGAGNGVWGVANVFKQVMLCVSVQGTGAVLNTNMVLKTMGQPCNKANTKLLHDCTNALRNQKVLLNAPPVCTMLTPHKNRVQFWYININQLGATNVVHLTKKGNNVHYNPSNLQLPTGLNSALANLITKIRAKGGVQ